MFVEDFVTQRRMAGLSQRQCAKVLGCSYWTVRQLDCGAHTADESMQRTLAAVAARVRALTQAHPRLLWASQLRARRRDAGFTQAQLATHLGVSSKAVGRWEAGTVPHYRTRVALATVLQWPRHDMAALLRDAERTAAGN